MQRKKHIDLIHQPHGSLPPALLGWTSISHINLHPHKSYRHSSPHRTKKQRSQSNQLSEEGRGGERKALPSLIIWGYEGWFREGGGRERKALPSLCL